MARFVLVHGAWQGAWAWARVVPLLEVAGHTAIAVDLPGNGHNDSAEPADVTTMVYAKHVAGLIDTGEDPVILVGHSMGGTVVAQASELRPTQIAVAVYLCAFLLPDGESIVDFYDRAWEDWMTGAHARVGYSDDGHLSMIDPASAMAVFYNTAAPDDGLAAAARLTPQPEGGRRSKLQLSEAKFGTVPRVYIETLRDQSVFHKLQARMYTETPVGELYSLDTDHAPQLSAPDALAEIMLEVAGAHS